MFLFTCRLCGPGGWISVEHAAGVGLIEMNITHCKCLKGSAVCTQITVTQEDTLGKYKL